MNYVIHSTGSSFTTRTSSLALRSFVWLTTLAGLTTGLWLLAACFSTSAAKLLAKVLVP